MVFWDQNKMLKLIVLKFVNELWGMEKKGEEYLSEVKKFPDRLTAISGMKFSIIFLIVQ